MMRTFKENPIFFSVTGVLLVVSLVFSAMYMLGSLSNSGFVDQFDREQKDLSRLKKNEPHPTISNLGSSEKNVRELKDAKTEHEYMLQGSASLHSGVIYEVNGATITDSNASWTDGDFATPDANGNPSHYIEITKYTDTAKVGLIFEITASNGTNKTLTITEDATTLKGASYTVRKYMKLQLIPEGTTRYEFTVKSRIREYALAKRRLARANGVRLKKGEEEEAFGFSNYVGETTTTNNDVLAREIDKQRAILDFLVDELLQSTSKQTPDIIELVAVRRENLEKLIDSTQSIAPDDIFPLDPKISARVEGAIDTYAFQFEFVGYTSGLRNLFNKLADFKLPVVVRDVNVKRAQLQPLASTSPAPMAVPAGSSFGAPFGTKSDPSSEVEQKPVVDKNLSHFTITLEFIELAQPVVEIEEGS